MAIQFGKTAPAPLTGRDRNYSHYVLAPMPSARAITARTTRRLTEFSGPI